MKAYYLMKHFQTFTFPYIQNESVINKKLNGTSRATLYEVKGFSVVFVTECWSYYPTTLYLTPDPESFIQARLLSRCLSL